MTKSITIVGTVALAGLVGAAVFLRPHRAAKEVLAKPETIPVELLGVLKSKMGHHDEQMKALISSVVLLDDGDAVVGDLVRGGFAFARIRPHHPVRHFFAEDVAGVRRGLDLVLEHDPRDLYVGHGGPNVHPADVRRRLDSIAPPK